jgi:cytochrome P450
MMGLARTYGDVAHFRAGPFDAYLLSHPDDIRDVLVTHHRRFVKGQGLQEARRLLGNGLLTSEFEEHRRQRRLIQPLFHHTRIGGYGDVMVAYARRAAERWPSGQPMDVHHEMTRLTLAIVGRTLFDADLEEAQASAVGSALSSALQYFDRLTLPWARALDRLPLPATRRFAEAKATLDAVIFGMIDERRRTGDRGDLLSMLLAARDEEQGGTGMTDLQVRDEAMTIFLAGHETTANALSWTWYLLSQHPDVERRLHHEVDTVLDGQPPRAADVERLPYTRQVVAESIRLYPPAWVVGRRALEDHPVGGYVLPAGSIVVASQYVVHHDARWWPDPFRFDPERFAPDADPGRPRYAYFPFAGGPRVCIGESFAWMEAVLVVATIAQRRRLRLVPGHPIALQPQITLRPKHGLAMVAEPRSSP